MKREMELLISLVSFKEAYEIIDRMENTLNEIDFIQKRIERRKEIERLEKEELKLQIKVIAFVFSLPVLTGLILSII